MNLKVPSVSLSVTRGEDVNQGTFDLCSIGYGLRQAWIYAAMFGGMTVFDLGSRMVVVPGLSLPLVFFISIVSFAITLFFAAFTNQRLLTSVWVRKRTAVIGAILACAGTALQAIPGINVMPAVVLLSGLTTGIGTAVLTAFWGVCFARMDSMSIMLNTSLGVLVGIALYSLVIRAIPVVNSGLVTAMLPLLELAIILVKTPRPFDERGDLPVFKPLPVNPSRFMLVLGLPLLAFGLALGLMRHTSVNYIMPAITNDARLLLVCTAACVCMIILLSSICTTIEHRLSRIFGILIPLAAIGLLFLAFSRDSDNLLAQTFIIVAYMSFEALIWIFLADLSSRYRLSPILVFGWGRGVLATASLCGSVIPSSLGLTGPLGMLTDTEQVLVLVLIMVVAYVLMPAQYAIEKIVAPQASRHGGQHSPTTQEPRPALTRPTTAASVPAGQMPSIFAAGDGKTDAAGADGGTHVRKLNTSVVAGVSADTATERLARASMPVNSAPKAHDPAGQLADKKSIFRMKVEQVANTYLLSRREIDVLFYLAKGHNAAYIQEKLYISEGTAKTHIRHIYRKLDVHGQQELMALVADTYVEA